METTQVAPVPDWLNLIIGITSIVLAIVSLTLSILFYVWSGKQVTKIDAATTEIKNATGKLEKIFNSLYADTFTMMKDQVGVMNRQFEKSNSLGSPQMNDMEAIKITAKITEAEESYLDKLRSECNIGILNLIINQLQQEGKITIEGNKIKTRSHNKGSEGHKID